MSTYLGTRLGTYLGTRMGTFAESAKRLLYGLSNFAVGALYATAVDGGESGASTGFVVVGLVHLKSALTTGSVFFDRLATSPSNMGWGLNHDNQSLYFYAANSTPALVQSAKHYVTASDLGRVFCVAGVHTGAGNTLQLWAGRQLVGTVAITGYTPGSGIPTTIGARGAAGSFPTTSLSVLAATAARGVPSAAQLQAYFDAARALGDLPATMQGATVTHRWSARDAAQGALVAPATLTDTVTKATADAMSKTGAPTVVTIDPSRDGRRLLGAQGFTASAYLETAANAGIQGSPTGFWVFAVPRWDKTPGLEQVVSCGTSASSNWGIQTSGTTLRCILLNGGYISGTYTIATGDLMQPFPVMLHFTGSTVRMYTRGAVQAGADVAAAYSVLANATMRIGGWNTQPFVSGSVFSLSGGNSALTLAEIQAAFASYEATGKAPTIPGKTGHVYDLTPDILAAGETVPAQVLDRVGSDHLSRTGTLTVGQRTERLWSYEPTPILYGAQGTTSAYYTTAGVPAYPGTSAAFFFASLIRIESQAVASATRLYASTLTAGNSGGYYFQTLGTNSSLWFVPVNVSGTGTASPSYSIAPADVGKLLLVTGVVDGPGLKCRLYVKRAEVGSGTTITGTSFVPSAGPLNLLRDPRGTLQGDNITVIGATWGHFVPSLAEIQAHHDAVQAAEDIMPIPGKSQALVSFKRDVAGGQLPATLADKIGADNMTRVGSPTLTSIFSRTWGW